MALNMHTHTPHSVSGAVWNIHTPNDQLEHMLMQRYGVSAPIASFLANLFLPEGRASDESLQHIELFLSPKLRTAMPDPYALIDLEKLVAILYESIIAKETIAIFGDYDVDGATSTALMVRYFKALGVHVIWHVPEREQGYGPNIQAFEDLYARGADLIICVDCGISAFDVLDKAHEKNMRICIIDHHLAQPRLPKSLATVNPNRLEDTSGLGNLCAVGVCFCVLVGLNRYLRQKQVFHHMPEPNLLPWLGLVAIGTVCDVVPLKGLNRVFVTQGLKVLNTIPPPAFNAIRDVADISGDLGVYAIGWIIGPYLNACGRMGQAKLSVEFLLNDDVATLGTMAVTMHNHNTERKKLVENALVESHQMVAEGCDYGGFICVQGQWADGIIGIVAGRLKDHYNKPAVVFSNRGDIYKASARSVSCVDVGATFINAVESGILSGGGGHKMAAGCSVLPEKYELFIRYLQSQWTTHQYDKVYTAHSVISPHSLQVDMVKDMDILQPYGIGNPEPLYIMENVIITNYRILKDTHIKCSVRASLQGTPIDVIAFQVMGTKIGETIMDSAQTTPVSMLGKLQISVWQGRETVQFLLLDIAV